MEDLRNQVDHLDHTIDVGDLIEREQGSSNLPIAAQIISKKFVNVEALILVYRKSWTKTSGFDIKEVDRSQCFILKILLS